LKDIKKKKIHKKVDVHPVLCYMYVMICYILDAALGLKLIIVLF